MDNRYLKRVCNDSSTVFTPLTVTCNEKLALKFGETRLMLICGKLSRYFF